MSVHSDDGLVNSGHVLDVDDLAHYDDQRSMPIWPGGVNFPQVERHHGVQVGNIIAPLSSSNHDLHHIHLRTVSHNHHQHAQLIGKLQKHCGR